MLRITYLETTNFGPFKGTQKVNFSKKPGVVTVYGENMRGKTSFLNAIRFALYGKVIARESLETSLHLVGNWEKAEEGEYGFSVKLGFEHDGTKYELIRAVKPKSGVSEPKTDADYDMEVFLNKGGSPLTVEESEIELSRVLPEQVSRFFLFDAELLQDYEVLLRDESEMGPKIRGAIERILGMPILINARRDATSMTEAAGKEESKEAQKDQKTRIFGNLLQDLASQKDALNDEMADLEGKLKKSRREKTSLESHLKDFIKAQALIQEMIESEKKIASIEEKILEKYEKLRESMSEVWLSNLSDKIIELRKRIRNEYESNRLAQMRAELVQKIDSSGSAECVVCLKKSKGSDKGSLEGAGLDYDPKALAQLSRAQDILDNIEIHDKRQLLEEIFADISAKRVEKSSLIDRCEEIREDLKDIDDDHVRKLERRHDEVVKDIGIIEKGIVEQRKKINEKEQAISKLRKELEQSGSTNLKKFQEVRKFCETLKELFEQGVGLYRDKLKSRIEKDASILFRRLTTEPDYEGLVINENYGLTIKHKNGQTIQVRSAGAEHIVALALVGSLQMNAHLKGPIIIDSPFGRLDRGHTERVLKTLPDMADQVIFLVYEDELDSTLARGILKGKLNAEYEMKRVSSMHTTIEKKVDNG